MASISTLTSFGSLLTSTTDLDGYLLPKYLTNCSFSESKSDKSTKKTISFTIESKFKLS